MTVLPSRTLIIPPEGVSLLAGVELGGTKCICVLATPDGLIVDQATVPTTRPDATLGAIERVLDGWRSAGGFAALGVASFGPVRLAAGTADWGHITSTSKPGWQQTDVAARLSRRYGVPVAFDTDVNGAALAEAKWGAALGLSDFAYVTLGTGVGVGLIVHGRATRGIGHCELGHMRVPRLPGDDWPGSCPFHGDCVEGLASGTAIHARLGSTPLSDIGDDHPVWDGVVEAAAQLCQAIVLATGVARILIGGGVANGRPFLLPRIDARLRAIVAGYVELPPAPFVTAPALGDAAGPLGPIAMAAALATIAAKTA
ncbi:fructokinase [Sphingomonas spermidinifaciens]|uniref:fructokinase n=1 Tax=Sphingomonas spermidinifaciens TaxID=1141889 RepID=A0A2A4B4X9_9SPHN|nr:ROK family protein [Sphingomonas spermidinifaciens]PCD02829.1 fructokinase [Sphingomonas spermidinifaciens]